MDKQNGKMHLSEAQYAEITLFHLLYTHRLQSVSTTWDLMNVVCHIFKRFVLFFPLFNVFNIFSSSTFLLHPCWWRMCSAVEEAGDAVTEGRRRSHEGATAETVCDQRRRRRRCWSLSTLRVDTQLVHWRLNHTPGGIRRLAHHFNPNEIFVKCNWISDVKI